MGFKKNTTTQQERPVKITKQKLHAAGAAIEMDASECDDLWQQLEALSQNDRKFDGFHILYYLGALIAIGAMGWFMASQWEALGGGAIAGISLVYAVFYAAVGRYLWRKGAATQTPGGLWVSMAVAMTPLFVYGIQRHFDLWGFDDPGEYKDFHRWIRGGWFAMEVATLVAAAVTLRFVRFPFLMAIIAFVLWFISMDITPILFGVEGWGWEERKLVSLCFGLAMLGAAYLTDLRFQEDFAFWLYLFGLMAFWGGLTAMNSDSEVSKFLYCLINLGLIGLAAFLRRRTFVVFGSLGVFVYLGHLSFKVFPDTVLFPVILSLVGVLIVIAGVALRQKYNKLEAWLETALPSALSSYRPIER